MKVIGVRLEPKKARYAIVEYDGKKFELSNREAENRLVYPSSIINLDEKLDWLYREFVRIIQENPDTEKICIKTNEFTQSDTKAKRETAYLEATVLLFARQQNIPVATKVYASLSTRSSQVKTHAENRVGKTNKYWDTKIADAIVAAWKCASE